MVFLLAHNNIDGTLYTFKVTVKGTVILRYFLPLIPQDTRQSKAFLIGNPNIFGTLIIKPNCILYRPFKSSLHKMDIKIITQVDKISVFSAEHFFEVNFDTCSNRIIHII